MVKREVRKELLAKLKNISPQALSKSGWFRVKMEEVYMSRNNLATASFYQRMISQESMFFIMNGQDYWK